MIAFTNNPMLSATSNSYQKALRISTYHDNALGAEKDDPFILSLYTPYHVIHLNLKTAVDAWEHQEDRQQGTTVTLQQLLKLLGNTKIRDWDIIVQGKYNKTTAEYKTIFPNHRIPFQTGTQLERLQAVDLLSEAVGGYTSLADLKTDIDAFNSQLKAAFTAQKEHISITKVKSEAIEPVRVAMCIAQYANLGALMQKNASNPEAILKYFDLSVLGNTEQTEFTGQLKPGEVYTIAKRTFDEKDQVSLANTSNATLKFYLAAERDVQPGTQGITLPRGKKTELANALGNLTDTYLTVYNTDTVQTGTFEVEIL